MKICVVLVLTTLWISTFALGQTYEVRIIEDKPIDPWANYQERMRQINEESAERQRRRTEERFLNESLNIQRERLRLEEERLRYIKYGY